MSERKSDGRLSTIDNEHEQIARNNNRRSSAPNPDEQLTSSHGQIHSSNNSIVESDRPRSKTVSTNTSDVESTSTGFNLLQSIKDLTHQELSRPNPLGLLGKEVISVTGTTLCPEPIPPKEDNQNEDHSSMNKCTPTNEIEPQQIHFPLNEEEKLLFKRRRSSQINANESIVLPPCPAEFISNTNPDDLQPHLFSQPTPDTMLADFIPDTMTINVFEVFIYAWGVCAFFLDMVTDLVLAQAYYSEGAYWLFILTLMCVIVPNLTLSVFSLVWYIDGSQLKAAASKHQTTTGRDTSTYEINSSNNILEEKNGEYLPLHGKQHSACQTDIDDQHDGHISRLRQRISTPDNDSSSNQQTKSKSFQLSSATADVLTWIIRIIILVLQLDLCLKYIRGLYYTWKGFQKRHNPKWARFYLTKQILIDADIALLRVFDCFMDSGSQVILQLYIMLRLGSMSIKYDTLFLKQCLSIVSSLGSLAYALSGYSRCWRHMQLTHSPQGWPKGKPSPQLVSWWSTIIQWFWYLFLITPRVLALAMFASTFRSWFWIILIAHWCGMLFWILRFRTIFCISDQSQYNPREAIFEKCYNLVCSYIFIFCYMNLRKGDTRAHYIAFYIIYYIENIAFSIIYAIHSSESNLIFKYSLVTFVCAGFWFAVFFQLCYYRFLHPSPHVRLSTKQNLSSMVHIRPLARFDRLKRSKSCEEMIGQNDLQNIHENNELAETTSLHLHPSNDERWHNRFSFANRQKLISQQQAIDQKVKLTRLEEGAAKRQHQPISHRFLTRISTTLKRPTTISTSLVTQSLDESNTSLPDHHNEEQSVIYAPIKRISHHHQQQSKMYDIHEDTLLNEEQSSPHPKDINNQGGQEMILTPTSNSNPIHAASSNTSLC